MRIMFALFTATTLAAPLSAQQADADTVPFFLRRPPVMTASIAAYREAPYRPVRLGEVRAAPFLTEQSELPFGEALGPVTPGHLRAGVSIAVVAVGAEFAVRPPAGSSYNVGDTLMVATVAAGPRGWGQVVSPTGLLEVTSVSDRQAITRVMVVLGPIRDNQVVLPAAPIDDPGAVKPVAVAGPRGEVISGVEVRELHMPGGQLFVNLGRRDGIRVGDFVEVRRTPGERMNAPDAVEETMATAQVIHVNAGSSTIRVSNMISPDIRPGTTVVRVMAMPN